MRNNYIQLIGYLGNHLSGTNLNNGDKRVILRVATHSKRKKEDGSPEYRTTWHDVVAWNDTAIYAERSFVKGSHILVEGLLEYRTYLDRTGHTRYITQIKAQNLINLDR